jgi:hypothetical protein
MKPITIAVILVLSACTLNLASPEDVTLGMGYEDVTRAMSGESPDAMLQAGDLIIWRYNGEWSSWAFAFSDGVVVAIAYEYY